VPLTGVMAGKDFCPGRWPDRLIRYDQNTVYIVYPPILATKSTSGRR